MNNPKRLLTIILLIIAVLSLLLLTYQRRQVIGRKYITINGLDVLVEIAKTDDQRSKGLSGRDRLPENTGMLFIFDSPKRWDFWMGGMKFSLDFIWIENNSVADITENVLPPTMTANNPVFVKPKTDVRYVLEVNSGWAKKNNIQVGDIVQFHL